MALIKAVKGIVPEFGKDCFLADNATITGDVVMGSNCTQAASLDFTSMDASSLAWTALFVVVCTTQ